MTEQTTICGCTSAGILSMQDGPCFTCGHANNSHNFGKGCRVSYHSTTGFRLEDYDVDYTQFRRLLK